MPTNPMLSAGHMGIVDTLKYGQTRDDATFAAALAAIGSSQSTLLLPFEGDGVWTFNTAWTIPNNVVLWIPKGVRVGGTGSYTINGQLMAFDDNWYQGSGAATLNYDNTSIGALQVQRLGVNTASPAEGIHVRGDIGVAARLRIENSSTSGNASVDWYYAAVVKAILGLGGTPNVVLSLQNSTQFIVTGGNVGLGKVPDAGQQLDLSTGAAQKATGLNWTNPSDLKLKEAVEPYTAGLDVLRHVQPISFRLNGRGGLVADGQQHVGYNANELRTNVPAMVGSYRAPLDPGGEDTEILTFKGGDILLAALVNTVKELAAQVSALTARIATLEGS